MRKARRDLHVTLKQANDDYDRLHYNTVVSAGMIMLNTLEALPSGARGADALRVEGLSLLLRVLYPVVPHTTWVLWRDLGLAGSMGDLIDAPWPAVDEGALVQEEIELVLQVNGKLRGKLLVAATADNAAIEAAARASPEVAKHASRRAHQEGHHRARDGWSMWWSRSRGHVVLAASLLARSSCGFHLRGDASLPFTSIFVNAPNQQPITNEFNRSLASTNTKVTDSPTAAEVVLDVPVVVDDKDVLSLSSGGSVREYALVKRVQFACTTRTGLDWMPAGEIVVRRSYTFNETQVLARELQEQRLLREMQTDAVQQIIRRLQTAKPA